METSEPTAVVQRLVRAANSRDLEALLSCFAVDYVNDTPAHPARSFRGREQVRNNWEQIFAAITDLEIKLLGSAVNGSRVWTEQAHHGTRRDGSPHRLAGVVVFDVKGDEVVAARFYLEPVETGGDDVSSTVRRQVRPPGDSS